jgi:acyl carrier protein
MSGDVSNKKFGRDAIFQDMTKILQNMTADWDTDHEGGIQPKTRLINDLGFESIDVVQLVVAIEEHYQRRDLPFMELLMENGRYVDDLQVGDAVDFLEKHLNA